MYHVVIIRDYFFSDKATLGTCYVYDETHLQKFKAESLERGWRNNLNMVSSIPQGTYPLVLEYSPRFRKMLWEVKDVPGRSEIKFHVSNYWHQLNGCIALGQSRKDIDGDYIHDVTSSRNTMAKFHEALEGQVKARLTVIDLPELIQVQSYEQNNL